MKTLALIDADIVGFRVACTIEKEEVDAVKIGAYRIDELVNRILYETNAVDYKAFLGGEDNFRYSIYPKYKANRTKPKPKYLQDMREHLVTYWGAKIINGHEADDELGIEQTAHGLESVICSIDKDLLQIPGYHYNFVKQEERFISPYDGLRAFYGQLISGDGSDNIPSYDGKIRNQVPQFIQRLIEPLYEMTDEWEMYEHCLETHCELGNSDIPTLHRNAKCLWVLRQEGKIWQPPNGQTQESNPSL